MRGGSSQGRAQPGAAYAYLNDALSWPDKWRENIATRDQTERQNQAERVTLTLLCRHKHFIYRLNRDRSAKPYEQEARGNVI